MSIWLFVAILAGVMISAIACVGLERAFVAIACSIDARRKSGVDELARLSRHQQALKRIDELERELKVGKYDPDRIALGFDDTKPEPKPLDPEVDDLPMPGAVEVNERCPCIACRSKRRDAKPVDDSWADVDVRDGVYGPETRGLVRRIVDNHGNWTEIRSFGS